MASKDAFALKPGTYVYVQPPPQKWIDLYDRPRKVITKQGCDSQPTIEPKIFTDGQYASGTTDVDNGGMVPKRRKSEQDRGEKGLNLSVSRTVQQIWVWYECPPTAGTSAKLELMNERRTKSASCQWHDRRYFLCWASSNHARRHHKMLFLCSQRSPKIDIPRIG